MRAAGSTEEAHQKAHGRQNGWRGCWAECGSGGKTAQTRVPRGDVGATLAEGGEGLCRGVWAVSSWREAPGSEGEPGDLRAEGQDTRGLAMTETDRGVGIRKPPASLAQLDSRMWGQKPAENVKKQ